MFVRLEQLGFGVAIGISLPAFLMSAFLVPALTALLGHAAWWPGHGDRPSVRSDTDPLEERLVPSNLPG